MAGEQDTDAAGLPDPPTVDAPPRPGVGDGEQVVQVGGREIARPAGTIDEVEDGQTSLADRLARADNLPAGPGDAGIG